MSSLAPQAGGSVESYGFRTGWTLRQRRLRRGVLPRLLAHFRCRRNRRVQILSGSDALAGAPDLHPGLAMAECRIDAGERP